MSYYRNGSTVRIFFTTHDTTGALVAPSSAFANTDFAIHKNGSAIEKTTTNGMTVTSPFDSIVGLHLLEIDTSNNTGDASFWAAAASYVVRMAGAKTVASVAVAGTVIGEICLDTVDANVTQLLGTAWLAPGVAGTPDVNSKQLGGTEQTGRDVGDSVLLSSGTGAGQLDFTSGVVKSNWVQILGATITGTAAQLAASITKFFNVATPTGTVNSLPDAVPGAANGVAIVGSEMGLTSAVITALFSDTDITALVDAIIARVEGDLDGSDLSVAAIAVAVRNEILNRVLAGNHDTAGTAGRLIQNADATVSSRLATDGYTAPPTAAANADAVWDEARAGHVAAGSFGENVIAELDSAARVKLDATQPDYAPATATQVNAEVLDVLNVDTFAEETGVPAATASLRKKIGWMAMWFRNKVTQTGTTSTLFADDGTTAVGTHTVSDDATTFTSGEGV